jgi:hypothetical protein
VVDGCDLALVDPGNAEPLLSEDVDELPPVVPEQGFRVS